MPHTPAQKREIREAKKAAGRCLFCPQPAAPGRVRCSSCADELVQMRETRKAAGLCSTCGAPVAAGKRQCGRCLETARSSAATKRHESAQQGLCWQCSAPVKPGTALCPAHSADAVGRARAATLRLRSRARAVMLADRARLHPDGQKGCRYKSAHEGPLPLASFGESFDKPDGLQQVCNGCRGEAYRRQALAYWRAAGIPLACTYCAGPFEHVDHVIPVSRGGTDDMENLVPACTPCNTSKGDKLLDEWLALRGAV